MSHIHRRVRLPVERARVPAPSDNRVTLAFGLLGLLALVGVIVAIAADEPGLRFLMAGVAVFMVLSVVFMVVLQQGRERGFIGHALKVR